jgi:hypothetical protein
MLSSVSACLCTCGVAGSPMAGSRDATLVGGADGGREEREQRYVVYSDRPGRNAGRRDSEKTVVGSGSVVACGCQLLEKLQPCRTPPKVPQGPCFAASALLLSYDDMVEDYTAIHRLLQGIGAQHGIRKSFEAAHVM